MNQEAQKFSERLNSALDVAGVPQKGMGRQSTLVRMIGVSHRVAKKWLEGSEFPPTSKMVKLSTLLDVRSNWLFSGQGVMRSGVDETDTEAEQEVYRHAGELSQEAFEIASDWMRLPQQQRVALKKVIKELGMRS